MDINNLKIKSLEVENTGGYIMMYMGKLDNGMWCISSDLHDEIYIVDKKPNDFNSEEDYEDYDDYEWWQEHTVKILDREASQDIFKQLDSFVDQIATDSGYAHHFHSHFNDLLLDDKEIDCEL